MNRLEEKNMQLSDKLWMEKCKDANPSLVYERSYSVAEVKKIDINGYVQIEFIPSNQNLCLLLTNSKEQLDQIDLNFNDDHLIITNKSDSDNRNTTKRIAYSEQGKKVVISAQGKNAQAAYSFHNSDRDRPIITPDLPRVKLILSLPLLPDIQMNGTGDFIAECTHQKQLKLNLTSNGRIKVKGEVDFLSASSNGTGTINTKKLEAKEAEITLTGDGVIKVNVRDAIKTKLSCGKIIIYGNQAMKVEQNVSGSGKIKFKFDTIVV